jgi:hypothetical protein
MRDKKILILLFILLIVVAGALAFLYFRSKQGEGLEELSIEHSKEVLLDVYGVVPVSGQLKELNVEGSYLVVLVDDQEMRYEFFEEVMCEQVGKAGEDCTDEEVECDVDTSISCKVEDIEVDETLGIDLDINSDDTVEFIRVHYIAQ